MFRAEEESEYISAALGQGQGLGLGLGRGRRGAQAAVARKYEQTGTKVGLGEYAGEAACRAIIQFGAL